MKVAFIYDRVTKWGGAERVLLALHQIWPDAPLYTAVHSKDKAPWAREFDIKTSFLQHVPFAKTHHELFPWLTPIAFESFSFDAYDVVISVTSAEAKDIITKPQTLHVCYCLTPTRYLWSGVDQYRQYPAIGILDTLSRLALRFLKPTLQRWDSVASHKPDVYIAISSRVASRIQQYYKQKPTAIIYPPVSSAKRANAVLKERKNDYFLVVSRLVGYKRVDIIVEACNKLGLPLVIIGNGVAYRSLVSRAKETITFVREHLTDEELAMYYEGCRALIVAADEDFGLAAAEAHAKGKPVIAYAQSGVAEIVQDKKTGILFNQQTQKSLIEAILSFKKQTFDTIACIQNAKRFSERQFMSNMKRTVERLYIQSKHT